MLQPICFTQLNKKISNQYSFNISPKYVETGSTESAIGLSQLYLYGSITKF